MEKEKALNELCQKEAIKPEVFKTVLQTGAMLYAIINSIAQ
ncbi:TPA: hypothetical protein ACN98Q_003455 [Acinetobacter baumannii]